MSKNFTEIRDGRRNLSEIFTIYPGVNAKFSIIPLIVNAGVMLG